MTTVATFDPEIWLTLKALRKSIKWYEEQPRDNDKYGTAIRKEKRIFRHIVDSCTEEVLVAA